MEKEREKFFLQNPLVKMEKLCYNKKAESRSSAKKCKGDGMEKIRKYMKTSGTLSLITMGVTLFAALYVFLIEHRLIGDYIQSLEGGGSKAGAGIGLGLLLVFMIIAAGVMVAFAIGELIIGLVSISNAEKEDLRRTPIPNIAAGVVAALLSAAGFAFFCIFSFDTAGFSVFSKIVYSVGLLVSIGTAITGVVLAVLTWNELRALRDNGEVYYR